MLALLASFLPASVVRLLEALSGAAGKYLLIGGAVIIWTIYQRHDAAESARGECRTASLELENSELKRQILVIQELEDKNREEAEQREQELNRIEGERNAAVEAAKLAENQSCNIPPDVLRRLRNIK